MNKELGWEYSGTYNAGLDFGLWKNRLTGTLEFYKTATRDLLMMRSLPDFSGSEPASVFQNVGSTSNTGFEAMLTSNNIDKEHFSWNTTFNFFTNKEKIVSLLTNEDMVGINGLLGNQVAYSMITKK